MNAFFSLDGKFYRFGTMIADLVLIGLLWTIFSLPIITIGATTTALYYVCTKKHAGQDVYIFKSFLKSFKANFVKGTLVFVILACIAFVVWMNLHILGQIDLGWLTLPVRIALWFVLFQVALVATNAFCILSRFEVTVSTALRYGLFMGYRHFLTTISNWVTLLAIFMVSLFFSTIFFLMGGIYVYFSSFSFIKLFRKHSSEFDERMDRLSISEE
ncbi:MAG: DUF624 domain-containing protein [Defluviitaleaceae bacterium]|nr:DUF624 domain-containing protein [Defluviitaleaceae bacterium]